MMPPRVKRSAAGAAAAAVIALALLGAGCQRPPDEAWLRFVGFASKGSTSNLSILEAKLRDATSNEADALFENRSSGVSAGADGTGILIHRARVDYRMARFTPPAAEYALNLYLPAGAGSNDNSSDAVETATLSAFPLATASLKRWLIETGAFEDTEQTPSVELTALVTFFAVTDEGAELQTSGGISISLLNRR